jgi:hypothetical protein
MIDFDFQKRFIASNGGTVFPEMKETVPGLTNLPYAVIPDTIIEPDDWQLFWKLWENRGAMTGDGDQTVTKNVLWETIGIYKHQDVTYDSIVEPEFSYPWSDWQTYFPNMFSKIFSVMPYTRISHITICSNIRPIVPHIDPSALFCPYPNTLRIMLHDENLEPTFYLTNWSDEKLKTTITERNLLPYSERYIQSHDAVRRHYVYLPPSSNTFVFSNGEFLHGADYHSKRKILMLIHGEIDREKWKQKLKSFLPDTHESVISISG